MPRARPGWAMHWPGRAGPMCQTMARPWLVGSMGSMGPMGLAHGPLPSKNQNSKIKQSCASAQLCLILEFC